MIGATRCGSSAPVSGHCDLQWATLPSLRCAKVPMAPASPSGRPSPPNKPRKGCAAVDRPCVLSGHPVSPQEKRPRWAAGPRCHERGREGMCEWSARARPQIAFVELVPWSVRSQTRKGLEKSYGRRRQRKPRTYAGASRRTSPDVPRERRQL